MELKRIHFFNPNIYVNTGLPQLRMGRAPLGLSVASEFTPPLFPVKSMPGRTLNIDTVLYI